MKALLAIVFIIGLFSLAYADDPCSDGRADCVPTPSPSPSPSPTEAPYPGTRPTPDPCIIADRIDCLQPTITPTPDPCVVADRIGCPQPTTAPTPEPTPAPSGGNGGGGSTQGGDVYFPPASSTPAAPAQTTSLETLVEEKNLFLAVPYAAFAGEQVEVKVTDKRTSAPLEGVHVGVYAKGERIVLLQTGENGIVRFTAFVPGILTYQAEKTGWKQANNPKTTVAARQSIQLAANENTTLTPQPSGLTGLFTAAAGNWVLLLLGAIFAYAGYLKFGQKK
ncbi:MAG TPA: hypothetical protein VI875_04615 [Candidatus Norongarragalinales archaeon]|nr:hypothetical protein [Candidatus Norongarragalinales archaeon]